MCKLKQSKIFFKINQKPYKCLYVNCEFIKMWYYIELIAFFT